MPNDDGGSTLRPAARSLAVAYLPLVAGSAILLVVLLSQERWSPVLLGAAVFGLAVGMLVAAACATHAFVRRRWWWGIGLLLVWPVTVPAYLWARSRMVEG